MKYLRKFYEWLAVWSEVVYDYRKRNNIHHYYWIGINMDSLNFIIALMYFLKFDPKNFEVHPWTHAFGQLPMKNGNS